jgi:hypothetical protein
MKWSYFMRRKGELVNQMMTFIRKMKAKDPTKIKYIRFVNDGENLGLKTRIEAEGLSVQLEFTSPETPEQNGQVERCFATLWGKSQSDVEKIRSSSRTQGETLGRIYIHCHKVK